MVAVDTTSYLPIKPEREDAASHKTKTNHITVKQGTPHRRWLEVRHAKEKARTRAVSLSWATDKTTHSKHSAACLWSLLGLETVEIWNPLSAQTQKRGRQPGQRKKAERRGGHLLIVGKQAKEKSYCPLSAAAIITHQYVCPG